MDTIKNKNNLKVTVTEKKLLFQHTKLENLKKIQCF